MFDTRCDRVFGTRCDGTRCDVAPPLASAGADAMAPPPQGSSPLQGSCQLHVHVSWLVLGGQVLDLASGLNFSSLGCRGKCSDFRAQEWGRFE